MASLCNQSEDFGIRQGWVLVRVSIDVFVMILDLMNKEGRKENSNPKKRERELYSCLKIER